MSLMQHTTQNDGSKGFALMELMMAAVLALCLTYVFVSNTQGRWLNADPADSAARAASGPTTLVFFPTGEVRSTGGKRSIQSRRSRKTLEISMAGRVTVTP